MANDDRARTFSNAVYGSGWWRLFRKRRLHNQVIAAILLTGHEAPYLGAMTRIFSRNAILWLTAYSLSALVTQEEGPGAKRVNASGLAQELKMPRTLLQVPRE
jgi:hypothetical protein